MLPKFSLIKKKKDFWAPKRKRRFVDPLEEHADSSKERPRKDKMKCLEKGKTRMGGEGRSSVG